jgi:hypothetical protein
MGREFYEAHQEQSKRALISCRMLEDVDILYQLLPTERK